MKKLMIALLALSANVFALEISAPCFIEQDVACNEQTDCNDYGYYVSGLAGINFLQEKSNVGFTGGVAVGYKFEYDIRTEVEFTYRRNNPKVQGMRVVGETYAYMGNVYYDLNLGEWTPYIGAGIGYGCDTATVKFHNIYVSVKKDLFLYQGIAGVSRQVWDKTHMGLEYRCLASKKDVRDHSVVLSAKSFF